VGWRVVAGCVKNVSGYNWTGLRQRQPRGLVDKEFDFGAGVVFKLALDRFGLAKNFRKGARMFNRTYPRRRRVQNKNHGDLCHKPNFPIGGHKAPP